MKFYVGQVLHSHKGRGPDRVQVIAIRGDRVLLRYLNRRRSKDFELALWFLEHPSCGWQGGEAARKGGA